jgi:hypothetical protein
VALLALLDFPVTTGNARRLARTMRSMGWVGIKSRRLAPGGWRNTECRGWARPVRELKKEARHGCHPDVSLRDWEAFREWVSPHPFEKVLDRSKVRLPRWYLPLARGAAIPNKRLLSWAGYRAGSHRARGWRKNNAEELYKDLGRDCLIVTRCAPFWRIGWDTGALGRPHDHSHFALVDLFGSTPVITRTCQEATYLAEFCFKAGHNTSLCWVHECPDEKNGAIDFSLQRCIDELLSRAA